MSIYYLPLTIYLPFKTIAAMKTHSPNSKSIPRTIQGKTRTGGQADMHSILQRYAHAIEDARRSTGNENTLNIPRSTFNFPLTTNKTGIPDTMKVGFENLSGFSFDDVRVHYNSPKPAQLQALTYTQDSEIHIAPGQEKHLGHELGHVAQQKQRHVQPTTQLQGVNENKGFERETDSTGEKAGHSYEKHNDSKDKIIKDPIVQRMLIINNKIITMEELNEIIRYENTIFSFLKEDTITRQAIKIWIEEKDRHVFNNWIEALNNAKGFEKQVSIPLNIRKIGSINRKKIANDAIAFVKSKITHGPENQFWARQQYGDEGSFNYTATRHLVNKTRYKNVQGDYNRDWLRPRRIGAAVEATGGGNCQDIAALTYNYLREHLPDTETICSVVNHFAHHAFATIGVPGQDSSDDIIVVDAWPRDAIAMSFSKHFCNGDGNIIYKQGQGGKINRINTLQSKYYNDPALLSNFINFSKNHARSIGAGGASWNHISALR